MRNMKKNIKMAMIIRKSKIIDVIPSQVTILLSNIIRTRDAIIITIRISV